MVISSYFWNKMCGNKTLKGWLTSKHSHSALLLLLFFFFFFSFFYLQWILSYIEINFLLDFTLDHFRGVSLQPKGQAKQDRQFQAYSLAEAIKTWRNEVTTLRQNVCYVAEQKSGPRSLELLSSSEKQLEVGCLSMATLGYYSSDLGVSTPQETACHGQWWKMTP